MGTDASATELGEGYVGDISSYADFIMSSEIPNEYKNGTRPVLYDDAGGLFYCHIKHAANSASSSQQCRDAGGVYLDSITDVRSMYSFIDAVRGNGSYQASNNVFSGTPVVSVVSSEQQDVELSKGGTGSKMNFQTLVRPRLNEEILHSSSASSVCSKKPVVSLVFLDNSGTHKGTVNLNENNLQDSLSCRNFAQVHEDVKNRYSAYENVISSKRDEDQWSLMRKDNIQVPSGATKLRVQLKAVAEGSGSTVDSILFTRTEFKLHN
jgi:hypothetical protein